MVELEFVDSPDGDILGKRVVYFDEISLGSSRINTIIVEDPDLKKRALRLSIRESGIYVENLDSGHYFSNDKKVSGKKRHARGDRICVGSTTFKIVSFKASDANDVDYDAIYQEKIQNVPYKDQLFHAIRQEMDDLETS